MTKYMYAMQYADGFSSRNTLSENVYFVNYITKQLNNRIMCQILCLN